ncbi:hypothetical protein PIROE2DRAFT_8042 [Piromyces sp. E2]|nr:hypothetical protein PIROE2DRAFT_8042 [Piromyces sp. E2]|eukprot:OUM65061.1 hypothetical protein PIROE2DRAFT_8042 [Piromyces sp. E2]
MINGNQQTNEFGMSIQSLTNHQQIEITIENLLSFALSVLQNGVYIAEEINDTPDHQRTIRIIAAYAYTYKFQNGKDRNENSLFWWQFRLIRRKEDPTTLFNSDETCGTSSGI